MYEEIEQQIVAIVAKHAQIDASSIRPDSTLDKLEVPSLSQIEILFDIEETFDISIQENPEDRSLAGLTNLVASLLAEKQGS